MYSNKKYNKWELAYNYSCQELESLTDFVAPSFSQQPNVNKWKLRFIFFKEISKQNKWKFLSEKPQSLACSDAFKDSRANPSRERGEKWQFCHRAIFQQQKLILSCSSSIFPVRLGEHHLRRIDWSEQLKLSSKAIVHPEYNRQNLNNDIMLIKLLTPITLSDKVKVLNLSTSCPEIGTKCLISGWGTTSSPQRTLTDKLSSHIILHAGWPSDRLLNKSERLHWCNMLNRNRNTVV